MHTTDMCVQVVHYNKKQSGTTQQEALYGYVCPSCTLWQEAKWHNTRGTRLLLIRVTCIQASCAPQQEAKWHNTTRGTRPLCTTDMCVTVKGARRQVRQRKRWEDNIREWTDLEFTKSQRAVENREKWRKLVAKSSWVPQRPSRLEDRWDQMCVQVVYHNKRHTLSVH